MVQEQVRERLLAEMKARVWVMVRVRFRELGLGLVLGSASSLINISVVYFVVKFTCALIG